MQRRSTPGCWVLLSVLAAVFAASCTENPESPPQIANLVRLAGDGQTAPIGSLLPLPLVVRVEDQHGVPLEGAVITFTVTTGSGVVTPSRRQLEVAFDTGVNCWMSFPEYLLRLAEACKEEQIGRAHV